MLGTSRKSDPRPLRRPAWPGQGAMSADRDDATGLHPEKPRPQDDCLRRPADAPGNSRGGDHDRWRSWPGRHDRSCPDPVVLERAVSPDRVAPCSPNPSTVDDLPDARIRRGAARFQAAAPGPLNADGEERRRAVCGRTARTVRWGAGGNQASRLVRAVPAPPVYPTTPVVTGYSRREPARWTRQWTHLRARGYGVAAPRD
jgi:hypothetical protein